MQLVIFLFLFICTSLVIPASSTYVTTPINQSENTTLKPSEWTTEAVEVNGEIGEGINWQYGKSLSESNQYMLDHQLATDVVFEVGPPSGPTSQIRAHAYVLVSRSAVFQRMLFTRNPGQTSGDRVIRVTDTDPRVFKEILNFAYTNKANLNMQIVLPVMYAAKKYQLPELVIDCQRVFQSSIAVDNVLLLLDIIIPLGEEELVDASLKFIGNHTAEVLKSDALMSLSREAMKLLVGYDWLTVREIDLFNTTISWAKIQLKKVGKTNPTDAEIREQLGDIFYEIRFAQMEPAEFAKVSESSQLLSCQERLTLFYLLTTGDHKNYTLKFKTDKRLHETHVERFTGYSVMSSHHGSCGSGQSDMVRFSVSKSVTITAVAILPKPSSTWHGSQEVLVVSFQFEILQPPEPVYSGGNNFNSQQTTPMTKLGGATVTVSVGNFSINETLKITLEKKLSLEANTAYVLKLQAKLQSGRSCYYWGTYGSTSTAQVQGPYDVVFKFADQPGSSFTTALQGQFSRIYYIPRG